MHAGQRQVPSEDEVVSTNVNREVRGEVQEEVKEEPIVSQPEKEAENIQKEQQTAQPSEPV